MKHAILGAGAVGGLVGAALAHEGDRVTLLVRPQTHMQHPGMLRLKRPYDTIEAPVRIETRLAEPVDVLWLAMKAHQLVAALRAVPPEVVTTAIVPLLNGIEHVNLLRVRFNHERVVPAPILVESERIAPGRIVQRSPFVRLALSMLGEHKLDGVASRLRHAGFSCEFQADEKPMLWSKEILAKVETLPATMRSSMQKDVSAGRIPELDALGGAIIRAGKNHGLDVPATRKLVAEIQERLNGDSRQPS